MNKILFLLHLPPPVHGSSLVGLNIKESIRINRTFECTFINLLASQNVAESGKVSLRKIFGFIVSFVQVFGTIIHNRPQLCYLALTTTGAAFYKDLLLVSLLRLFRIKRVYHLHNKGVSLHQHKGLNRMCYRFVFKGTDIIILSKYLYPDIQKFVPENRILICPNGIPYVQPETGNSKTRTSVVQILFLSNLIKSKGVFNLLEAMALLKKKGIAFKGIFIGGEGDITTSEFNEQVSYLGLSDKVNYLGKKYGKEKNSAFSEADIFIHPTYNDCFPLVLLEAMSYSLPVVSTFEGGIPDIVEDGVTGFLVPQKNVETLAEKIELLINNPGLRQQMGEVGRKKYEKEFTLEQFETRLVEILNTIAENKE